MDKLKFFAIFIPVLIGLAFLFRVLIPVVIASIVACIITMILFNKKNTRSGFFSNIRTRGQTRFVCLGCGFYHNSESCPKCGSKIKKFYESREK